MIPAMSNAFVSLPPNKLWNRTSSHLLFSKSLKGLSRERSKSGAISNPEFLVGTD
jgi:hypothetical protein